MSPNEIARLCRRYEKTDAALSRPLELLRQASAQSEFLEILTIVEDVQMLRKLSRERIRVLENIIVSNSQAFDNERAALEKRILEGDRLRRSLQKLVEGLERQVAALQATR